MTGRYLKLASIVIAAAVFFAGCGNDTDNSKKEDVSENTSSQSSDVSSAISIADISKPAESTGIYYPRIALTREAFERILTEGKWLYPSSGNLSYEDSELELETDTTKWYFDSAFTFKENGEGYLTIGGFDSLVKYEINDDLVVKVIRRDDPLLYEEYGIGTHERYGTVLYSTVDEKLLFYQYKYDGS